MTEVQYVVNWLVLAGSNGLTTRCSLFSSRHKVVFQKRQTTRICVIVTLVSPRPWSHDLDTWSLPRHSEGAPEYQNEVCRSIPSNVRARTWHRDTQTETDATERITTPHWWVVTMTDRLQQTSRRSWENVISKISIWLPRRIGRSQIVAALGMDQGWE